MIKLKSLLLEAFVPDKSEFKNAVANSEYKIIRIVMTKHGQVYIEDAPPEIPSEDIKVRATLNYNDDSIDFYTSQVHGNKISPSAQQLIAALTKRGVIDSSWKVKFNDKEGYYLNGDYVYKYGEYENLPPNFWKRNTRVDIGENLKLYHGTTEIELPNIKKYGLKPLGFKTTIGGTETRLRIEDNKNFIYLTGTFVNAFGFAESKSRSNMLRIDKNQYQWTQYHGWDRWFIKPVVLLVTIPDFTKLRSDDDRLLSIIKSKARELWKNLPPNVKTHEQILSAEWFKQHGVDYKPEQISDYLWVISDNGFSQTIQHVDSQEWKNWKASLKSHNQVAYEGTIPPNYLQVIDLHKVFRKNDLK
jgi:hypothetical protein